jgi:hypothetical protein
LELWPLWLFRFGDRNNELELKPSLLVGRRFPGCSKNPCRARELRVACVSRGAAMVLEDPRMMMMMNNAGKRTCF